MIQSIRLRMALALGLTMLLALAFTLTLVLGRGVVLAEDQPDGSTIVSPQTTDGTWGPGTITAAADVVINAGVAITIAPGTTIRVADGVGFTVNGDLHSDGPVTFTAISGSPGSWDGITYAPGSSGYLNQATIEYATHALTLDTANPIAVSNSHLRYNRHRPGINELAYGAGLYIVQGDHRIEDTRIYSNTAAASGTGQVRGAGVYIVTGASQILNSWIYQNTATGNNAGAGGGIALAGGAALIEGSHVVTNTLAGGGNILLKSGGGIGFAGTTSAVVRGSWIAANRNELSDGYAGGGGIGFTTGSAAALIERSVIYANHIQGPDWCEGGGVDTWSGNAVVIRNNLIISNTSGTCRSGSGAYGGGVYVNGTGSGVHVVNNTIVGNQAGNGGGLYMDSGTIAALNNVVVGNSATYRGGGIRRAGGTVDYNDVFGNTAPTGPDTDGSGFGTHNLNIDPYFLGTGDLVQQYHLSRWSPVVNAGTGSGTGLPNNDYDGDPRPLRGGWDIGFDEIAPSFAVTKVGAPDPVGVGGTLNYAIVIVNTGEGDATNLAVSDAVPVNTAYVPGSSRVTIPVLGVDTYRDELRTVAYDGSNGTIDWSGDPWSEISDDGRANQGDVLVISDLGDNSIRIRFSGNGVMRTADLSGYTSARLTFEYRRSGIGSGEYVVAEISGNGGLSWTELGRFGEGTDSSYQSADYDITSYMAANTIVRFLSSGLGSSDYFFVDNVQVEARLDGLSTYPGGDPPTLVSGVTLNAGKRMTVTFAVAVNDTLPAGVDEIANSANVTCAEGVSASRTATTVADAAPDLALDKDDGGATVTLGGVVVYTLAYANNGTQGASGVALTETVPGYTTFDAANSSAGWACVPDGNAGATCTLAVGGLAAGDSGTADFAVSVASSLPQGVEQVANAASIADDGANGSDLTPGDNRDNDTTPVVGPDLTITKSDGGTSALPGGTIAYTLSYANNGNRGANGVVLTETVPDHTTFDAAESSAGWVCVPDGSAGATCTLAVGSLGVGNSGSATFAVTVDDPLPGSVGSISNAASIADDGANGPDLHANDNQGADTTGIGHVPVLSVAKSGPDTAYVGQRVTYNFAVSHDPDSDGSAVSDVRVTDDVAGTATYVSGDVNGNNKLDQGETWSYAASYTIQGSDPDPLVNTGTVTGKDLDGSDVTASDSHSTALGEAPEYRLFLPAIVRQHVWAPDLVVASIQVAGDSLQVVVENQGNAPVTQDFWVDVYVGPDTVPTAVNQVWDQVGSQGMVWGVTVDLQPGETLTLAVGDAYYMADFSHVNWPIPAGTAVYAQVDSANTGTDYGAVLESHEITGGTYNNILGPVVTAGDVGEARAIPGGGGAASSGDLPFRP